MCDQAGKEKTQENRKNRSGSVSEPLLLLYMLFNRFKTFRTDNVFDPAGVLRGHFRINSQTDKPGGEKRVAFVNAVGDLPSRFGQGDISFGGYDNMAAFS